MEKDDKEVLETAWAISFGCDGSDKEKNIKNVVDEMAQLISIVLMGKSSEYLQNNKIEDRDTMTSKEYLDYLNKRIEESKE